MKLLSLIKIKFVMFAHSIKLKIQKLIGVRKKEIFESLINEYRGKGDYDCIVPFSGGKDSTYVLYKVVKEHNLKPLVISFDHGFYRGVHLKM